MRVSVEVEIVERRVFSIEVPDDVDFGRAKEEAWLKAKECLPLGTQWRAINYWTS